MDSALQTDGNLLDRVKVTLTRRDVALMSLCLRVVARDHTRDGNLRSDIESLQTKLAQCHSGPSTSRKKQAGYGEECQCQQLAHDQKWTH